MRILALADLSGRAAASRIEGLAGRRPLAVDVDNLEKVFARLAPRLLLEIDGTAQTIEFAVKSARRVSSPVPAILCVRIPTHRRPPGPRCQRISRDSMHTRCTHRCHLRRKKRRPTARAGSASIGSWTSLIRG